MRKLISILICFAIVMTITPCMLIEASGATTYYVSPEGSDSGSGQSENDAWGSFKHAARQAQAGDTVIFKDGIYNEEEIIVFTNSGTENAKITFKSENKQGAKIVCKKSNNAKINILKDYIVLEDFDFTQTDDDSLISNTSDILVRVRANNCEIRGNKFSNVYEEAVKLSAARNVIVENNEITGTGHEGIDAVNAADCIIRNNTITDCGRTGVMIKGNSRNCQIYNNTIKNTNVSMTDGGHAFTVGGQTGIVPETTLGDWSENTGFEAYNCVFYNNIVYCTDEKILNGFSFLGAKDCHVYNNVIYGAKNAFSFKTTDGDENGWGWNVPNINPVIKNNIVMNTSVAYNVADIPENMDSDYNLFYNAGSNVPTETNSIVDKDPLFINAAGGDFSIPANSPVAKSGTALPTQIEGFEGFASIEGITADKKIPVEQIDFKGKTRKTPYDIGAYNRDRVKTVQLLYEDFESGTEGNDVIGWNGWINKSTDIPNDSFFKIQKESNTSNNLVGDLTRTKSDGESKTFTPAKNINEGTSAGEYASVKFKLRTDNSKTQAAIFRVYDTDGKSLAMTLYFNNSRVFFGGSNKYITSGAMSVGAWYEFEFFIHFAQGGTTANLILNGSPLFVNEATTIKDISYFRMESSRNMGTTETNADGTSVVADIKIDDISIYSIGAMEPLSVEPTEDGALNKAVITFSNEIKEGTLTKEDIEVNGGSIGVSSAQIGSDKRKCIVTFAEPLSLETQYNITIGEVEDVYGLEDSTSVEKTLIYKTRDRKFNVGEIKFYKDFNTVNEAEIQTLADGNISAALNIVNEKTEDYKAALIMVHKRDGKVMKVKAVDASVSAETLSPASRYAEMTLSGVTAGDSVEAYLWDSVQGMKPVGEGKIITPSSVQPITADGGSTITAITLDAAISNATADSGTMSLAGDVTPTINGMVTAYVLKPGYGLEDINFSNFDAAVDFAGQKAAEADGSYNFTYTMQGAVNNAVYTAYAGGNSISVPKKDTVTFFGSDYIARVVTAVNNAAATQIAQMLAGTIAVPNVTPSVMLNTVLGLNLDGYNALRDYGDYEKYKTYVAEAMEAETFIGVEDIRAKFPNMVQVQKAAQDKYLSLLNEINNSLWSNLAQKFQENDTEANRLLHLNWSGSYASIKNNPDLLEKLYKKLETIPFNDFNDLRYSFENEAKLLIPPTITPDPEPDYGGGGGGGGGVKYSPGLAKDENLEPIAPQETVEESVSFDDLDSVPWAQESIGYLAQNNIINGVDKKKFAPNAFVTREQFVKMVVLAMNLYNEDAQTTQFMDVEQRGWYNSYVASAVEHGIVHGVDNEHFGVGQNITRAEMAAILCRAAQSAGKTLADTQKYEYADNADIPDYAREAVNKLGAKGIMNGIGNGLFAPREQATRAMAAKVIFLLMGVN